MHSLGPFRTLFSTFHFCVWPNCRKCVPTKVGQGHLHSEQICRSLIELHRSRGFFHEPKLHTGSFPFSLSLLMSRAMTVWGLATHKRTLVIPGYAMPSPQDTCPSTIQRLCCGWIGLSGFSVGQERREGTGLRWLHTTTEWLVNMLLCAGKIKGKELLMQHIIRWLYETNEKEKTFKKQCVYSMAKRARKLQDTERLGKLHFILCMKPIQSKHQQRIQRLSNLENISWWFMPCVWCLGWT